MENWKNIIVRDFDTLLHTMKLIDETSLQFAVVLDVQDRIVGTVTDGDIRRAILRGEKLDIAICQVMNKTPIVAKDNASKSYYLKLMQMKKLKQLPIVNDYNKLVNVLFKDNFEQVSYENTVILMVGGLGTRLRPLTNHIPKPMLKVGGKPILETIIEGFKRYGYTNFIFTVNYKKEIIQNYFQNGESFGVNITYIEETKRMGTAGALSLLPHKPEKPIFVMNGDLLTQVNFEQLMLFHTEHKSTATMCVREYEYQVPYGVIKTEGTNLISIEEKPVHRCFVNAGIYVLNPESLSLIPKNEYFDMPTLFEKLIDAKQTTSVFPIREYWLDIGRTDDFERANEEFSKYYTLI